MKSLCKQNLSSIMHITITKSMYFVKVLFEMQSCLNYPFDVEKLI